MSGREQVVVVGASGFGREALDVLEAMSAVGEPIEIVGVIDDGPSAANRERLADRGVPYLGTLDRWLTDRDLHIKYVLGIGSPTTRRHIVGRLDRAGCAAITAIHPTVIVGAQTRVGEGSVVCAGAVVSTNVDLGRHVHVNPHATIGHDSVLHDYVSVNPAATISGEVEVGEESLVGAAAVVLQNLTVGQRSVIGAGAVVTKNVPSDVVVKGIPGTWSSPPALETQ